MWWYSCTTDAFLTNQKNIIGFTLYQRLPLETKLQVFPCFSANLPFFPGFLSFFQASVAAYSTTTKGWWSWFSSVRAKQYQSTCVTRFCTYYFNSVLQKNVKNYDIQKQAQK